MTLGCLSGVFGSMVMRGVVLKIQTRLSIWILGSFKGKVTDPPRSPTSSFRAPEVAGPVDTENHTINLSPCLNHQLLTYFWFWEGSKKPSGGQHNQPLGSPLKPLSHTGIEVRMLCLKGGTAGEPTPSLRPQAGKTTLWGRSWGPAPSWTSSC